jgi:hypothetical protein
VAVGALREWQADQVGRNLPQPEIMGPPVVWLASAESVEAYNERIVVTGFEEWLRARESGVMGGVITVRSG